VTDERVLLERDEATGIARITINNADRRNCYDPPMRHQMSEYLDDLAVDDHIKVVVLRGAGGIFSTGADMGNAYAWYDPEDPKANAKARRPSQRRRITVDRRTFGFYHEFMGYPKVTVAEVQGFALGGGFELALMADIAVVGSSTKVGMPGTRLLGPALGSLHMFFHRLGPVQARRLLLTGDTVRAETLADKDIFTEVVDDADVTKRADWWARKIAKMPADGLVMAKEAFRLVEQLQAYQGEEVLSYMFHAYGTNLQFDEGEFNFVKERAQHGTKQAFKIRDEHFEIPQP
jgi:enoyl-CoA hydratase